MTPPNRSTRSIGLAGLAIGLLAAWLLAWLSSGTQGTRARAQAPDPAQLEQGAQLYAENCVVCHGARGEGRVGATLAKDWPSIRPELTVRSIIENGIPGSVMPAWSQEHGGPLTSEEIDSLVTYILSWQTGGAPEPVDRPTFTPRPPITPLPDVEGDPNQGAILFAENCVVCHGPNGEGRVGTNLNKDWPSIRPDLNVHSIISNGIEGSVMPAWSQENGGPLSGEQINHLVAFVLTQPGAETAPDSATNQQQIATAQAAEAAEASIPWLRSWGGALVILVVLVGIVAAALILQRRS